jgi:hypothetical protein
MFRLSAIKQPNSQRVYIVPKNVRERKKTGKYTESKGDVKPK